MKTVFITGTTTGIGLYTARHMHRLGWHVFAGVLQAVIFVMLSMTFVSSAMD